MSDTLHRPSPPPAVTCPDSATNTSPTVLITGAARRVGAQIARTLHRRGCRLVLHYRRSRDAAEALCAELNDQRAGSAATVGGDLATPEAPARIVAESLAVTGRLDGLVNNASSFYPTPLGSIGASDWDELAGSNLRGPLFLSQAAAPHLREHGGAIVSIIDIHAERPLPGYAVYSAAKAGLAGLTRALALELAPRVRVNGVAPGAILWPEDDQYPPAERERIIAQSPLRRAGSPEDIAGAVAFLLLDAPYVTGQILAVDGGRSLAL